MKRHEFRDIKSGKRIVFSAKSDAEAWGKLQATVGYHNACRNWEHRII